MFRAGPKSVRAGHPCLHLRTGLRTRQSQAWRDRRTGRSDTVVGALTAKASRAGTPWPGSMVSENAASGDGWLLRRAPCSAQQPLSRVPNKAVSCRPLACGLLRGRGQGPAVTVTSSVLRLRCRVVSAQSFPGRSTSDHGTHYEPELTELCAGCARIRRRDRHRSDVRHAG